MSKYALVFCGGGIGSVTRLLLTSQIGKYVGTTFPWGTLVVNLLGAFSIGLLIEVTALKLDASSPHRHLLVTGFLGGFTTFSAFSLETVSMWVRGDWGMAATYVLVSVVGTVILVMGTSHFLRGTF